MIEFYCQINHQLLGLFWVASSLCLVLFIIWPKELVKSPDAVRVDAILRACDEMSEPEKLHGLAEGLGAVFHGKTIVGKRGIAFGFRQFGIATP